VLYGRDRERSEIWALLEAARSSRSGALVLRGEAGIGKSALLEDARDRASDMHVLSARGVESESELPFAALHQLMRPALAYADKLPEPQARAFAVALGLDEGEAPERFLAFVACLTLLSELSEHRPVLCLVDDAHWLDEASADALRFVARRLGAEGIALLFAAREGDIRAFEAEDVPSLTVTGLDNEASAVLLARGRAEVAPSVQQSLVAQAGGNALALVELPSVLTQAQLAGDEPLPEALPLTRQLEAVFSQRVAQLPDETRRFLLVAAADDTEDVTIVSRAGALLELGLRALDPAEEARLVQVRGTRLEFRHPLIRSAVYGAATSGERRGAHRALAAALADDRDRADRRAWHLAASAIEQDPDVVRALDEAAERAEERAGHIAAARALERAAELSDDVAARGARLARAARNLSIAGRDELAATRAKEAAGFVTDPVLRAALAQVQGVAAIRGGRPREVVPVLTEAARVVAPVDPAKALELLMDASICAWQAGDRAAYLEVARSATVVAPPKGDEFASVITRSFAGFLAMAERKPAEGAPLLREVVEWGAVAEEPYHAVWASFAAFWLGDATRYRLLVEHAGTLARARGELGALAETLGMRSTGLAMEHRFEEATVAASEAVELARELGAWNLELLPRAALAIVAAVQGRDEEARAHGQAVVEEATERGLPLRASVAVYALALADLAQGRWGDALERLDSLLGADGGPLDPVVGATISDKIEAAVRAGRVEEAKAALPLFEERAAYAGLPSIQPRLLAYRGLLSDGDEATAHFEEALRLGQDARPLDLARIHLLFGEHLRRSRRRSEARVQLRAAVEAFERLRAEPWAERARAELRASGETARKRDPSTVDQLTAQELHIAQLVSGGLTNKEVAAQLFLSPRTIDAHLRNIFGKVGVRSRTQLARLELDGGGPVPAPTPA
jgi:DNA-binding CsgD family transcriptional regulator